MIARLVLCLVLLLPASALANEQDLSHSTKILLSQQLSGPILYDALSETEKTIWLGPMLDALPSRSRSLPNNLRAEVILTLLYESKRAGLDPLTMLAVMDVESDFRKYAISSAGARGLMQIMPFWKDNIGTPAHNLFDVKTNIRYGCVIMRHYLNIENGNITRALLRYNGSLKDQKQSYAISVLNARSKWERILNE